MSTDNSITLNAIKRRNLLLLGATLFFILAATAYGGYYMLVLSLREETDNAYVGGNLVMLTSQVAGDVQEIHADETQLVKGGC